MEKEYEIIEHENEVVELNEQIIVEDEGNYNVTLLLAYFLGLLGIHRFYNKKYGTGVLMLLTFGGLGFWYIFDVIMIISGRFKNKAGVTLNYKEESFFKNSANIIVLIFTIIGFIFNITFRIGF